MSTQPLCKMSETLKGSLEKKINTVKKLSEESFTSNTRTFSDIRNKNATILEEAKKEIEQLTKFKEQIINDVPREDLRRFESDQLAEILRLQKQLITETEKSEQYRKKFEEKQDEESRKRLEKTSETNEINTQKIKEIGNEISALRVNSTKGEYNYQKKINEIEEQHQNAQLESASKTNYIDILSARYDSLRTFTEMFCENLKELKTTFDQFDADFSKCKMLINGIITCIKKGKKTTESVDSFYNNLLEATTALNSFEVTGIDTAVASTIEEELKKARTAMRSFQTTFDNLKMQLDEYSQDDGADVDLANDARATFRTLFPIMDNINALIVGIKQPTVMSYHDEAALTYKALQTNTLGAMISDGKEGNKTDETSRLKIEDTKSD